MQASKLLFLIFSKFTILKSFDSTNGSDNLIACCFFFKKEIISKDFEFLRSGTSSLSLRIKLLIFFSIAHLFFLR